MRVKLRVSWKILCKRESKVWLALPIETQNQKILQIKIPKEIDKAVRGKFYHYWYLETKNQKNIRATFLLELNKISKYKEKGRISNKFLKNNRLLQLEKIRPLAFKLKTPERFYRWIIKNIKFPKDLSHYLKNLNWADTSENILLKREGECSGKSLLFVSLCRSVGIPAILVSGYLLKSGEISLFNAKFNRKSLEPHQWAEFHDGEYWVPVDCSLAQEENKKYFGHFDDYRIVISKDLGFNLINNGKIPFLQIGEIKPKDSGSNIILRMKISRIN